MFSKPFHPLADSSSQEIKTGLTETFFNKYFSDAYRFNYRQKFSEAKSPKSTSLSKETTVDQLVSGFKMVKSVTYEEAPRDRPVFNDSNPLGLRSSSRFQDFLEEAF